MTPEQHVDWCRWRVEAAREKMPLRFRTAALGDVEDGAREQLCGWAFNPNGSILLDGPVGTGKTYAAWALYVCLLMDGWVGRWQFATEADYLLATRPDGDKHLAAACWKADVLHLDDLAAQAATDYSRATVFALLDHRWANDLPTIVTTNLKAADLRKHLGDRASSRLGDKLTHVTLTGKDRRR